MIYMPLYYRFSFQKSILFFKTQMSNGIVTVYLYIYIYNYVYIYLFLYLKFKVSHLSSLKNACPNMFKDYREDICENLLQYKQG